jgi:predicted LPLAT superfamily acyltransferase
VAKAQGGDVAKAQGGDVAKAQGGDVAKAQGGDVAKAQGGDVQHWASYRERGAILGMRLLVGTYRWLGRSVSMALLRVIIAYYFVTSGKARAASRQYLQQLVSTPEGLDALGRQPSVWDAYRHLLEFGRAGLDRVASWVGDMDQAALSWDNSSELLSLAESGRGALLIGAHLGNIEMLRAIAQQVPQVKINALVFNRHAKRFNDFLRTLNPDMELAIIPIEQISIDVAIDIKNRVDRGEFVSILADRTSPNANKERVIEVPFLGRLAPFPQGPFILASQLDCPVYLLFCLREKDSHYRVYLESFAERIELPRSHRQQALTATIERYAQRLEYYCCLAPYQWFNFFDFWKR